MGKLARDQWEEYTYARDNGHMQFVKKARMTEDFFAGLQWDEKIRRKLVAEGKPVLTLNKTLATVASILGEQLSNRADISFLPSRAGNPQTAEALATTFLQVSANNMLDWRESEVFADGLITSRGYYDARVSFSDSMQGEARVTVLNPVNVLPDPQADSYDPDDWGQVFITKWLSLDDIAVLYGKRHATRLKNKSTSELPMGYDSIDSYQYSFGGGTSFNSQEIGSREDAPLRKRYRVVERQYRKMHNAPHFVDPETGDMRKIPADWKRDKIVAMKEAAGVEVIDRLINQIRWTATVDDIELFDEWSPLKHFTVVPFFPYFRRGRTIGVVETLFSTQEMYNKTRSQMLHIINTTANSGWIVKNGSLQNMDIEDLESRGAETGLVLEVSDVGDIIKIQPNSIPTGLDRIAFELDEDRKDISGVSDSMRGQDRADVSAKAITQKKQSGSLNFAKPMDNLAQTRRLLARNLLDIVQSFYTEERLVQITGGGLTDQPQEITINQTTPEGEILNDLTLGEYSVRVTSVPHRDSMEEGVFQQVMDMKREGIQIPDHILVEVSNMPRKAEIAKAIKEANGGGEQSQAQQQMAELEVEARQLENQKLQAESAEVQATAQLQAARAITEQATSQQGGDAAAMTKVQGELEIKVNELQLERERLEAEIELKRQELELKREIEREKLLIQRAASAEELELKRQTADADVALKKKQQAVKEET